MTRAAALSAAERWAALSLVADFLVPLVGKPVRVGAGSLPPSMVVPASHHLVSPALGWCLADEGEVDPLRDYFAAALELNRARNEVILTGLDLVLVSFAERNIVPVAMKECAVLLSGIYPDLGARFTGDLDLFIAEGDLDRAADAVREARFAGNPENRLNAWHHHLPVMIHSRLGVGVELHRRPLLMTRIVTGPALIQSAVPARRAGRTILLPAPTDMVAQLVARSHIADGNHHGATVRLRYLLDLVLLIRRFGDEIDWTDLKSRFASAGRERALVLTSAAADHFFGPHTPFADRAPTAVEWLKRGLGRSAARRWLAELPFRAQSWPFVIRHEPRALLTAMRLSRWRTRLRPPPEPW